MVTIIVLPLLSIFYLRSKGAFSQYRVIEVNMPDETEHKQVFEFKKNNRFEEFGFTNNHITNDKTISQIDSLLQNLKVQKNSLQGIRVNFDIHSKYSDLIQILNSLDIHGYKTYLLEEDKLWILWHTPVIHEQNENNREVSVMNTNPPTYVKCGTQEIIRGQYMSELRASIIADRKFKFESKIKELWILGFAYIFLFGLSIIDLRKFTIR